MRISKRWLFGLAALCAAVPAHAWNAHGHMTVAAIAWADLTPAAKEQVTRLLRLNPDYKRWVRNVAPNKRDETAFLRAAVWSDGLGGTHIDDGHNAVEPIASQNLGYSDPYIHRYWHYRDTPFSIDGTPVEQAPAANAVSRIQLFSATLADPGASDDVKSYDLTWLLHMVGDIHNPLHAIERYAAAFPHGDAGGNGVKICEKRASKCGFDDGLHIYWDAAIGDSPSPKAAIRKARKLPPVNAEQAKIVDPEIWAQEGFDLAKQYIYVDPIGTGVGPYRLTAAYERTATVQAETRIGLAGARLAEMLNSIYR